MKKVIARIDYHDLRLNRLVKAGEVYEVTDERAEELSTTSNKAKTVLAEIIEDTTPPTEKVAKAAPKKKKEAK